MNETDQGWSEANGTAAEQSFSNVSPGERLRAAREAQGLSTRAVATHLNLPAASVEALEADDFERLPPATFVRGYLRSYARLLDIDADEVVADYEALEPDQAQKIHIYQPLPDPAKPQRNTGAWVVGGGIAVALMAAGLAWFQGAGESGVPEAVEPAPAVEEAPPIVVERSETREQESPGDVEREESPASAVDAGPEESESPASAANAEPIPRLEAVPDTSAQQSVAAPTIPPPNDAPRTFSSAPVREYSPLVIRVDDGGEAWIEVEAGAERLVRELVVGPETIEFNHAESYQLVIGDVRYVEVDFAGEAVNLRPHTRNRVARFSVSDTE